MASIRMLGIRLSWIDARFNPATMKIPDFMETPQTWPTPIVQGKPGASIHPNRPEEKEVSGDKFSPVDTVVAPGKA